NVVFSILDRYFMHLYFMNIYYYISVG
ncbi:hypothetical protein, partial [Plasmodium yoelii yoelii]